jgi:hypothetical protein
MLLKTYWEEVRKMKRNFFVCLVVFVVALALALPAFAQEKKDKPKSEKIKNALIVKAAQPDAGGKFASISIQTDKGTFPVLRTAIAKKMEPYAGSGRSWRPCSKRWTRRKSTKCGPSREPLKAKARRLLGISSAAYRSSPSRFKQ